MKNESHYWICVSCALCMQREIKRMMNWTKMNLSSFLALIYFFTWKVLYEENVKHWCPLLYHWLLKEIVSLMTWTFQSITKWMASVDVTFLLKSLEFSGCLFGRISRPEVSVTKRLSFERICVSYTWDSYAQIFTLSVVFEATRVLSHQWMTDVKRRQKEISFFSLRLFLFFLDFEWLKRI